MTLLIAHLAGAYILNSRLDNSIPLLSGGTRKRFRVRWSRDSSHSLSDVYPTGQTVKKYGGPPSMMSLRDYRQNGRYNMAQCVTTDGLLIDAAEAFAMHWGWQIVPWIGRHENLMNGREGSICFIDFLDTFALNTKTWSDFNNSWKKGKWVQES